MKKYLFLIITTTIFATVFSGCSFNRPKNESSTKSEITLSESTTDKTTVAETVTVSKPQTEAETASETESETDFETELETQTTTESQTEPPTTVPPTEPPTTEPPTTIPPTEPPTTVPPTEPPTTLEIIDFITKETSVTSDYKYGIKKITTTYDNYYIYSDGSEKFSYSYTDDSYDYSGYAATDSELLDESVNTAAANMEFYNEVLLLVNQIRADAGVQPLTLDTTLCQAATMRSLEMNYSTQFSHTRPNGNSCFDVFNTFSITYNATGENIAAGYRSPSAVVEGWKNSSGHYANMINSNFNKLGVGMSNQQFGYGIYWTQLFTN